jgi:hypothetical protein
MTPDRSRGSKGDRQHRYKDRYHEDNAVTWHYVFSREGKEVPVFFSSLAVGVYEGMMRKEFGVGVIRK